MAEQSRASTKIPKSLIYIAIIFIVASWIPLAWLARARVTTSPRPRVHIFQDMDAQPRFDAQAGSGLFLDRRAMRMPVEGTVARGSEFLRDDDHYYRGYETDGNLAPILVKDEAGQQTYKWHTTFPSQITVNRALLERGRERFNIYCAVCHGYAGYGNGMIQQRVDRLNKEAETYPAGTPLPQQGWVQPASLHDTQKKIPDQPVGRIFNTISNGQATMPAYGSQIDVADRWAIVAYVKALQLSQNFNQDDLTEQERAQLETAPPGTRVIQQQETQP